ncbi:hypothetical protein HMPREF1129_2079 [Actinomyces naeslundii str. Howell 279]|uniref:Uncharacterized protein n=1 Tax=Actinomyces naeslundii (strain ATCC 12104 / DSM 43013 / CCUG 2238 / JCM 8349 / NCTC 10301 / Howell 279) TaxID=1115803 RepID=J3F2I0_ACTNH|nr:hypothetical protein HMPREF1129_2079 [Actinomyces naeslundii str. Howell 279]
MEQGLLPRRLRLAPENLQVAASPATRHYVKNSIKVLTTQHRQRKSNIIKDDQR